VNPIDGVLLAKLDGTAKGGHGSGHRPRAEASRPLSGSWREGRGSGGFPAAGVRPLPSSADYLRRALRLAARGRYRTSPNPKVGAVLVRDGEIVGSGWHRQVGGPHAEVEALNEAGERARGATLYVTLEPCAHHGRTSAVR